MLNWRYNNLTRNSFVSLWRLAIVNCATKSYGQDAAEPLESRAWAHWKPSRPQVSHNALAWCWFAAVKGSYMGTQRSQWSIWRETVHQQHEGLSLVACHIEDEEHSAVWWKGNSLCEWSWRQAALLLGFAPEVVQANQQPGCGLVQGPPSWPGTEPGSEATSTTRSGSGFSTLGRYGSVSR